MTLLEEGPKALADPKNYAVRANLMWCATQALNGLIGCGVPQDWITHMIGHELTALYGVDHAQSLAIVYPGVLQHQKDRKRAKLLQYAERVVAGTRRVPQLDENARLGATAGLSSSVGNTVGQANRGTHYFRPNGPLDENARIDQAIAATEEFFRSLGVGTRLSDYNIPADAPELVVSRLAKRRMKFGEHQDLGEKEVKEILELRT